MVEATMLGAPNELRMLREGNIGAAKLALQKNGFALPRYSDASKLPPPFQKLPCEAVHSWHAWAHALTIWSALPLPRTTTRVNILCKIRAGERDLQCPTNDVDHAPPVSIDPSSVVT
ncbi:Detected protein of unknown function [Hibiscus syriacus]|uniref:Uncharacterized protein n=1 Tax=Hibiscus syriacus TaxID=106335 RepID=A0A6A2YMC8_HIBSY|nr:Detected protein of unknown function [Hibiscus syriacus]